MSGDRPGERVAGIIVAGGSSTRMGFDKLWADLGGMPLIAWSLNAFARCTELSAIVLVVREESLFRAADLLRELGVSGIAVQGGVERRDSVLAGLNAAPDADWVVVHDAARPCMSPELVSQGLEAARFTGAAIAAVPVVDTIKRVDQGAIVCTEPREQFWAAQTPQVFRRDLLVRAHHEVLGNATDDAGLVEALGVKVRIFLGSYANIKVTNQGDLQVAGALTGKWNTLEAPREASASVNCGKRTWSEANG